MTCDIAKMKDLAERWMHNCPVSPALMLGDQRLAHEALQAAAEIERLRAIVAAYATIEAARRIGRMPPERCLDAVRDYWALEAAKAAGGGG